MADEQIRIDITAEDDASRVVDDVADAVDELERATPEVTVTADVDDAERGIKAVGEDAEALSRQDTEILLRAKIDDAKAALKELRDDLEQTGRKAGDTQQALDRVDKGGGSGLRGQAIADLTGPLGDASGAASDFAGVFDGIADISESVATKVGVSAGAMTSAIGGIGVAVAGAAALWSYFTERQKKAREEQKKLEDGQRKINDAIREGNTVEAAEELIEQYRDAFRAAEQLGLKVDDVTRFITGQADAIPGLNKALDELKARQDESSSGTEYQRLQELIAGFDGLTGSVDKARAKYEETNGTLEEQDRRTRDVASALSGMAGDADRGAAAQARLERQADRTRSSFDRIRGALDMGQAILNFESTMKGALERTATGAGNTEQDVLDIKQAILDVAEAANLTPIEVKSYLERIDQGDLAGVLSDVQARANQSKVELTTKMRAPTQAELNAFVGGIQRAMGPVYLAAVINSIRSG